MSEVLDIHGKQIAPGEQAVIKLTVARLPSGTRIHLQAHVFRAEAPGPVALMLGGVHGDEINGVEIVRRMLAEKWFHDLQFGTVIAIPLLNIYGFLHFSRDTPDGKDVNRNFPGSLKGSLSSRVARSLTKYILPHVDFGVDFHTGGASRYNYPQIRYNSKDEQSLALAQAFAAPVTLAKRPPEKSLRKVAAKAGIPILIYEGGEALRFDGFAIQQAIEGTQRLLAQRGMLAHSPTPPVHQHHFTKTTWIRAPRSGIFEWTQNSGTFVREGELLGTIRDPYGQYETRVKSRKTGFIIGHNNAPVISQGDALFNIAW